MSWWTRLWQKESAEPASQPATTEDVRNALHEGLAQLERQMADFLAVSAEMQRSLAVLDNNAPEIDGRLSTLDERLSSLDDKLDRPLQFVPPLEERLAAINDWVERSDDQLGGMEDQLKKLNRSHFKTNTLTEAQGERLQTALESLDRSLTLNEQTMQQVQEQFQMQVRQARLQVIASLLPVLDGIEQALASGRDYLRRQEQVGAAQPTLPDRIAYALGRKLPPPDPVPIQAWLHGLTLVQERMLYGLAQEGVRPVAAKGYPFDPYRHVAVALADPDAYADLEAEGGRPAPGIVVEEQRRGYAVGDQVLRFAEVVVMPAEQAKPASSDAAVEALQSDSTPYPQWTGDRPARSDQAEGATPQAVQVEPAGDLQPADPSNSASITPP